MLELFSCIKNEGVTMSDDKSELDDIEAEKWLELKYSSKDGQKLKMPERFASIAENTAGETTISQENVEEVTPQSDNIISPKP